MPIFTSNIPADAPFLLSNAALFHLDDWVMAWIFAIYHFVLAIDIVLGH